MTLGNYTGYNWTQRLNNMLLYGEAKRQFVYPNAVGRWYNFWTPLGGDPFVLDDILEDSMVNDEEDRYDDVMVYRIPFTEIGHDRHHWFQRDSFIKQLCKRMERHLYLC